MMFWWAAPPNQNIIFDHFLSEPSHFIRIEEINQRCLQTFSITVSTSPEQGIRGAGGMYGVRNMLPFLSAAGRALMVVIGNYIYSCMVFSHIVMLAALILLKVLLILPPLDFPPLLVEGKVSYLPKE